MTESLENCQLPQVTDEETEAIITYGLAKFTDKVAKPGLQPVSNSGPHFTISYCLSHF